MFLRHILIFKGLTERRLYKSFGFKGLTGILRENRQIKNLNMQFNSRYNYMTVLSFYKEKWLI
jgi:hypothetical protein